MATGIVKWFNDAKGFGFIEPDEGGGDVFAHFSAIAMDGFRTLKQGARVEYDISDGPKGKLALNIKQEPAAPGADVRQTDSISQERRNARVRAPQFHAANNSDDSMVANK